MISTPALTSRSTNKLLKNKEAKETKSTLKPTNFNNNTPLTTSSSNSNNSSSIITPTSNISTSTNTSIYGKRGYAAAAKERKPRQKKQKASRPTVTSTFSPYFFVTPFDELEKYPMPMLKWGAKDRHVTQSGIRQELIDKIAASIKEEDRISGIITLPKADNNSIHQFRIRLAVRERKDKIQVWRRVLVPSEYTLKEFSRVLLILFSWSGVHCSEFTDKRRVMKKSKQLFEEFPSSPLMFGFQYDMGKNWKHAVYFEKVLPADNNIIYPLCIGGAGAVPEEDVSYSDFEEYGPEGTLTPFNMTKINESLYKHSIKGGKVVESEIDEDDEIIDYSTIDFEEIIRRIKEKKNSSEEEEEEENDEEEDEEEEESLY